MTWIFVGIKKTQISKVKSWAFVLLVTRLDQKVTAFLG
jgi:hypothetical protein